MPTNEFLNYSDKERKASDSANLASISSSSANVDSDLSAISGKLDTIITLITPEASA